MRFFQGDFMKYKRIIAGTLAAVAVLLGARPLVLNEHPAAAHRIAVQSFLDAVREMLSQTTEIDTLTLRSEGVRHLKYMDGNVWGLFEPEKNLTRAEAAQILYNLLANPPKKGGSFADVPDTMWYAQAVNVLARMGIMRGDDDGYFHPEEDFTRAQCAQAVAHFLEPGRRGVTFDDVPPDAPYYDAVCAAAANGLFSRPADGFRPDDALTRAEAAAVFNQLLGRSPDEDTIRSSPQLCGFPDVPETHWAYAEIMEATTDHEQRRLAVGELWTSMTEERVPLADGFHNINGWLYCVRDGKFLCSRTVDGFTFGADGRYLTGNLTLDEKLAEIIRRETSSDMTDREKLRAVYRHVRDNFTYIKRRLVSQGQEGWEPAYAEAFLKDGRGNCFGFAATFCLLARQLGFDAHTVVGWLGQRRQPHGWVEIKLNGRTYVYDAELEMKYRSSDFFHQRYGNTEFDYYKS